MKKILGLDLGTNSIGWAVVSAEEVTRENGTSYLKPCGINSAGSRRMQLHWEILLVEIQNHKQKIGLTKEVHED